MEAKLLIIGVLVCYALLNIDQTECASRISNEYEIKLTERLIDLIKEAIDEGEESGDDGSEEEEEEGPEFNIFLDLEKTGLQRPKQSKDANNHYRRRLRPSPVIRGYAKAARQHMRTVRALRKKRDLQDFDDESLIKALRLVQRQTKQRGGNNGGGGNRPPPNQGPAPAPAPPPATPAPPTPPPPTQPSPTPAPATPAPTNAPATLEECPIPDDSTFDCNPDRRFRNIDGTCNNLQNPKWGGANRAIARFIDPAYADGTSSPRVASNGGPLPSARSITSSVFQDVTNHSPIETWMHVTFGQFLDHDVVLTPTAGGEGETVSLTCGDGCSTEGEENENCFPIEVPAGDPDFGNQNCLFFVRSEEGFTDDCSNAVRTQMNELTSWVDASQIYGSSTEMEDAMRDRSDRSRGRLAITPHPLDSALQDLLPTLELQCGAEDYMKCFIAGDVRVNDQVGLSSMHTLWQRAHNLIEEELHALNPGWGGGRLYQETRKIVTAVWQHIVYNEYLPTVVGPDVMDLFDLWPQSSGFFQGYNEDINPDITSSFSTAAFRYGHSQIGNFIQFSNNMFTLGFEKEISHFFFNPSAVYNITGGSGVDAILLGHLTQPAEESDTSFSKQITAHLFTATPPNGVGTDLPALNIQRGRDHGLPSYNDFREFCGLPRADGFGASLSGIPRDIRRQLRDVYDNVDDVDLYVGGMAETHVPGGNVGPTFACLFALTFRNLKVGDRFFYENDQPTGFSEDQLDEIRKVTLSRIMCDNMDNVDTIQKYALLQPASYVRQQLGGLTAAEVVNILTLYGTEENERAPCSELPAPDLTPWRV